MHPLSKPVILLLMSSLIASCGSPHKRSVDQVIQDAISGQADENAELNTETPEYYIRLASETDGDERHQYLLKAAQLLVERGDIQLAQTQLQNLQPGELEGDREIQINLLAANIAIANNNPVQALDLLPPEDRLKLHQRIDAAMLRAEANFKLGYYVRAAETRIAIDPYIEADDIREQNHQGIWLALSSLPDVTLNEINTDDRVLQGWLELAQLMRASQTTLFRLQEGILDWGTEHPEHPVSNAFIDSILDAYLRNRKSSESIALLLPTSGKYAAIGEAIQNGFVSAHYENSDQGNAPRVRFYDTGDEQVDFDSLFERALLDGATAVIGPLDKKHINRLAQRPELDVPVLTLNYAENPLSTTSNLFQYGLLPEDEAVQAAELAIKQGRRRAVLITPATAWGERLNNAFRTRFMQLGGKIVGTETYDVKADDFSKPIKRLFDIDASQRRHRDLQRLLDTELEFQPWRRQDVDMIFLGATYRSARGLMPAFRFHRAGDLPVYATSHVYSGSPDRDKDRDLNGLVFCDLPWHIVSDNELRARFEAHWPQQRALTRLFAMGIDAYYLVRNLNYLESNEYARFPGETGNLYLDEQNRFHRELVWAKFINGLPRFMDTYTPPARSGGTSDTGMETENGDDSKG